MLGTDIFFRIQNWSNSNLKRSCDIALKLFWLCITLAFFHSPSLEATQVATQSTQVQDTEIRDKPLKAAYLYNFAKYIQVPVDYERSIPNRERNIVIGIVGSSEVESHLRTIAGRKTINGKTLIVKKFKNADSISACHILFISSSLDAQTLAQVLLKTNESSAYVVADTTQNFDSIHSGFYYEDNKIKFAINLGRVEQKEIRLSSNLLRLGKLVRTQPKTDLATEQHRLKSPNASPNANQQSATTPSHTTPNQNVAPPSIPPTTDAGGPLLRALPPQVLPPQTRSPQSGEPKAKADDAKISSRRRQ